MHTYISDINVTHLQKILPTGLITNKRFCFRPTSTGATHQHGLLLSAWTLLCFVRNGLHQHGLLLSAWTLLCFVSNGLHQQGLLLSAWTLLCLVSNGLHEQGLLLSAWTLLCFVRNGLHQQGAFIFSLDIVLLSVLLAIILPVLGFLTLPYQLLATFSSLMHFS